MNIVRTNRNQALGSSEPAAGIQITLDASLTNQIRLTESFKTTSKTRRDYCNRLDKIIGWMEGKINTESLGKKENGDVLMISDLVRGLSEEELGDKQSYHNSTKDLIYGNLHPNIIKAFITSHNYKPSGEEQYSYDHLRKYHDAVLHGSTRSKKGLPTGYKEEMAQFLDSLEKSKVQAKKNGEIKEEDADPIRFPLYKLICNYAINKGDAYFWFFTTLLWNLMARPINIDDLQLKKLQLRH